MASRAHVEIRHAASRFRLLTLAILLTTFVACAPLYHKLGGAFTGEPAAMHDELSAGARALLDRALDGFDETNPPVDFHVHLFTREVHPWWTSRARPGVYGRFMVYLSASAVEWSENLEEDYIARLHELTQHYPRGSRFCIYAMDHTYRQDGTRDEHWTAFYVSNEYVTQIARQHSNLFVPVISVHPYRPDALDELRRWAAEGVRHVKWLPNTMGFSPADPRLTPFYEVMREHGMGLFTHTGDEQAIEYKSKEYGNPQLLRLPLEMGVKVVALHAASAGSVRDLDDPQQRRAPAFDLLMRMMDEPRWDGLLFAELSAVTFSGHLDRPLRVLLAREDLHHRIVNGSDYPLCAVNVALRPAHLARLGFITSDESLQLEEIYNYNPLLFDFIVKRTVRHPETGQRFAITAFTAPDALR